MASLKTRVLAYLTAANFGDVSQPETDEEVSVALRSGPREVTDVLWALQKQGLVEFRESHGSHGSSIHRPRLTARGSTARTLVAADLKDRFEPTTRGTDIIGFGDIGFPRLMPATRPATVTPDEPKEAPMATAIPQPTSNKGRLLAFMMERAQPGNRPLRPGASKQHRGWVGMDVKGIARSTGIAEHDVVHSLHDMREQGLVDFQTRAAGRRTNGGDVPVRVRVMPRAFSLASEAIDDLRDEPLSDLAGRILPVDAAVSPEPPQAATQAAPDEDTAPEPVAAPEPPTEPVEVAAPFADIRVRPELTAYPLLADLLGRDGRRAMVTAAAELLSSAGLDEMALEALDKVGGDLPVEREMVSLLRAIGY